MRITTDLTETRHKDTNFQNSDMINIVQPLMGPDFDPERDIIDFSDSEDDEINESENDEDQEMDVDDIMKYITTGQTTNKKVKKFNSKFNRRQD